MKPVTPYWPLTAIILLAFFLRVWDLPRTPPGLWYDEAYYSMDAAWLLDGGPWRLFFAGNNGREPIFIYLQTLFIWMFGAAPLTSRLIAPLFGTLTVPVMYVLSRRLARRQNWPGWLPYVAAFGLATSFWHLGLSRGGYRGILLPLAAALTFYAFWRGWRERSFKFMLLAGLALGLSQYTYLAARVFPVIFAGFALLWTFLNRRNIPAVKALWQTVAVMAGTSALIFAPLGLIFWNDPTLFSARTGDVFFTPNSAAELWTHLSSAIRLFIDAGDPNWRHHLPGRPMLGWLGWLGFWPGLIICVRRVRRPVYLFLLVSLLTLYVPALLSTPPVHALRLSALLPIYYIIFVVGLFELPRWIFSRIAPVPTRRLAGLTAMTVAIILLTETGLTVYDYFGRWANTEETYVEYNGPLVDFVEAVITRAEESPVVIPFHLYVHPTTRYLLHDHFTEQPTPTNLTGPVQLVDLPDNFRMLNVANIPPMPSYVWLAQTPAGGAAYVSRPPRSDEQAWFKNFKAGLTPEIYSDRFNRDLAHWYTLADPAPLLSLFNAIPMRTVNLTWPGQAQLTGYDVSPVLARPNQPLAINLYWRSLTEKTFDSRLFLQLIDAVGNPVNQWEGEAFREDMYRWRPNGILPTQHTLWLGSDTPPGPYLVRLGFFDDASGERLPLQINQTTADQVQLGLFYVTTDDIDPRQPAVPLSADFGDAIRLTGATLPQIHNSEFTIQNSQLSVTFHWQTIRPTDQPYTVFLQLLNGQGEVVSGWDSQPFDGLYPTNLWSPGELITDAFALPLPEGGLPPGDYRLITGFYDVDTGARLPVASGGDFTELTRFTVE